MKTIIFDGKNMTAFEDHVKSQNLDWKELIRFIQTKLDAKIYIGSFEQLTLFLLALHWVESTHRAYIE